MSEVMGFVLIGGIYAALLIGFYVGRKQGYKDGQIDQKKGIIKKPYKLYELKDGERKYMRESELKDYFKSYVEGAKIIE